MHIGSCLICFSPSLLDYSSSGKELSSKNDEVSGTCTLIDKELRVLFILHNLFELPRHKLQEHLTGGRNPSSWGISLCSRCHKQVQELKEVYQQLMEITRKFNAGRELIINIAKRKIKEKDGNGTNGPTKRNDVLGATRKFIFDHNYGDTLSSVDAFRDGDQLAQILSKSYKPATATLMEDEDDCDFQEDDNETCDNDNSSPTTISSKEIREELLPPPPLTNDGVVSLLPPPPLTNERVVNLLPPIPQTTGMVLNFLLPMPQTKEVYRAPPPPIVSSRNAGPPPSSSTPTSEICEYRPPPTTLTSKLYRTVFPRGCDFSKDSLGVFKCPLCRHKSFKLKMRLKYHAIAKHLDNLFKKAKLPGISDQRFKALCKQVLVNDISQDNPRNPDSVISCFECGKKYTQQGRRTFENHCFQNHFQAMLEKLKIRQQEELRYQRAHGISSVPAPAQPPKLEKFQCRICREKCEYSTMLTEHRVIMHPELFFLPSKFDQEQVPLSNFKTNVNLLYLQQDIQQGNTGCYSCPLCTVNCKTRNRVLLHMVESHYDYMADNLREFISKSATTNTGPCGSSVRVKRSAALRWKNPLLNNKDNMSSTRRKKKRISNMSQEGVNVCNDDNQEGLNENSSRHDSNSASVQDEDQSREPGDTVSAPVKGETRHGDRGSIDNNFVDEEKVDVVMEVDIEDVEMKVVNVNFNGPDDDPLAM